MVLPKQVFLEYTKNSLIAISDLTIFFSQHFDYITQYIELRREVTGSIGTLPCTESILSVGRNSVELSRIVHEIVQEYDTLKDQESISSDTQRRVFRKIARCFQLNINYPFRNFVPTFDFLYEFLAQSQ